MNLVPGDRSLGTTPTSPVPMEVLHSTQQSRCRFSAKTLSEKPAGGRTKPATPRPNALMLGGGANPFKPCDTIATPNQGACCGRGAADVRQDGAGHGASRLYARSRIDPEPVGAEYEPRWRQALFVRLWMVRAAEDLPDRAPARSSGVGLVRDRLLGRGVWPGICVAVGRRTSVFHRSTH